jgi:hypothetical protein
MVVFMKKLILSLVFFILVVFIALMALCMNRNEDMFYGLSPKAIYEEYEIYDLVEQRGLACAEAIEILDQDNRYEYYFNCLKSDQIYLVSDSEIILVKDAYKQGIITKEKLYELGIIDRNEINY